MLAAGAGGMLAVGAGGMLTKGGREEQANQLGLYEPLAFPRTQGYKDKRTKTDERPGADEGAAVGGAAEEAMAHVLDGEVGREGEAG